MCSVKVYMVVAEYMYLSVKAVLKVWMHTIMPIMHCTVMLILWINFHD